MKYFSLLTGTVLILCGNFGFTQASKYSDPIKAIETKMPIYYAIYNYDKKVNGDDRNDDKFKSFISELDSKLPATDEKKFLELKKGPYKRSPLHRAIEHMEPLLIEWILERGKSNNADLVSYGVDKSNPKIILSSKQMAGKPGHLVGHLGDYYSEEKKDAAKGILALLKKAGLDIAAWPARTEAIKKLRNEWNDAFPITEQYKDEDFVLADDSLIDDSRTVVSSSSKS